MGVLTNSATVSRSAKRHPPALLVLAVMAIAAWLAAQTLSFCLEFCAPSTGLASSTHRSSQRPVALRSLGFGKEKEARKNAKEQLLDLLDDEVLAQEVLRPEGKPTRGRIDEMIVQLERLNPTEEPVYSEILDGAWHVKYSGTYAPGLVPSSPTRELALFLYGGGYSLGNALSSFAEGLWGQALSLQVRELRTEIQGGRDVDAVADIEIFGNKEKLSYKAELLPLSSRRMSEEIVSVEFPPPIGSRELPFELRRQILVTYLDNELMIVRDESGVADVLKREVVEVTPTTSSVSNSTDTLGVNATDTPQSVGNATD